jgi:hypothetical protein
MNSGIDDNIAVEGSFLPESQPLVDTGRWGMDLSSWRIGLVGKNRNIKSLSSGASTSLSGIIPDIIGYYIFCELWRWRSLTVTSMSIEIPNCEESQLERLCETIRPSPNPMILPVILLLLLCTSSGSDLPKGKMAQIHDQHARSDPVLPIWYRQFRVEFNETSIILFKRNTQGTWYYDADNENEMIWREDGRGNNLTSDARLDRDLDSFRRGPT